MIHTNPTTEISTSLEEFPTEIIPQLVLDLKKASIHWKAIEIDKRISALKGLAQNLEKNKTKIAETVATEMGKPLQNGISEVIRTVEEVEYLIAHAKKWLAPEHVSDGEVHFQPLGITLVISPWNFPFLLPLRSIIPALIAGNSVIFKPSELTPQSGILLETILKESCPMVQDYFKLVLGGKKHGQLLVSQNVQSIAFTGSCDAGKSIAKEACDTLKRFTLELGGLDPAIILNDVDVNSVSLEVLKANIFNSGQVCNAVKRVLVHKSIEEAFLKSIIEHANRITLDDPLNSPDMGPVVSLDQLSKIDNFLEDAKLHGAIIHTGGKRLDRKGFFFPPTILSKINSSMKLVNEEVFGPILPIQTFTNIEEAIELANSTKFGLTASVWTKYMYQAKTIAKHLDFGTVSINCHKAGNPGSPWGGAKESGIGRMKTKEGLREFTNTKLIKI